MSKNLTVSNLYNMCKITYDNVTIASSEKFGTEAYLGYKDNKVDFIYKSKENEIVVFSNVKHIVLCEINIVFVLREEEQECLVVFNKKGYIVKKIYGYQISISEKTKLSKDTLIVYDVRKKTESDMFLPGDSKRTALLIDNKTGEIHAEYENVHVVESNGYNSRKIIFNNIKSKVVR